MIYGFFMEKIGIVYRFHPSYRDRLVEDLQEAGFELRKVESLLGGIKHYFVDREGLSVDGIHQDIVLSNSRRFPGLDAFLERWAPSVRGSTKGTGGG
jgi:hypothetical protein